MDGPGEILTIGYGNTDVVVLLARLRARGVTALVDVRSAPYSRRRPELCRKPLAREVARQGLIYRFFGRELGGRPDDPSCYVRGKLSRGRARARPAFRDGLARLRAWRDRGETLCLLCAECDPLRCHRFHLIGDALGADGVEVRHVLADGGEASQAELRDRAAGGQLDLFASTDPDDERDSLG